MQCSEKLTWIRWSYDEETNAIDKQPVSIEDPYDDNVWELTEQQFQQALLENNDLNERDKFELLEIIFGAQDDQCAIYLTMSKKPTGVEITSEIILHLNTLLEKGVDLSDSYVSGYELYKCLLKTHGTIKCTLPSLNMFYLVDSSNTATVEFVKNYQNEDFSDEIVNETVSDRSVIPHLSLVLGREHRRGQYSELYQYHFNSNVSLSVFQKDCEEFVEKNPLSSASDLADYANAFLNYLLGKNYQQVNAYTQNLDNNTIANLLGVELNQEGRFDVPEPPAVDSDDDDELPF
jgi:hypothetical protein